MNHLVFGLLHCCREAQVLEAEKGTLEPSELNINSYYPVFPVLFQELPNSDENHHVTVILTHFLQIQRIAGKLFFSPPDSLQLQCWNLTVPGLLFPSLFIHPHCSSIYPLQTYHLQLTRLHAHLTKSNICIS